MNSSFSKIFPRVDLPAFAFSFFTGLLTFALVLSPSGAGAAIMAYEGFNYPAGDSLTNASAQGAGGSF